MRIRRVCAATAVVAGVALAVASPARADVILTPGNLHQTGQENILFTMAQEGLVLQGFTQTSATEVHFTGNETLVAAAAGQALIEAKQDPSVPGVETFDYLKVHVPSGSFTSLVLNIDATANGTVNFYALDTEGTPFAWTFAVTGNGSNFFTFTTINNQAIASIWFDTNGTSVHFVDAAQFRIGLHDGNPPPIPEPASMLLLGTGLAALAAVRRRRRKIA